MSWGIKIFTLVDFGLTFRDSLNNICLRVIIIFIPLSILVYYVRVDRGVQVSLYLTFWWQLNIPMTDHGEDQGKPA
jgi:hypothetical protein